MVETLRAPSQRKQFTDKLFCTLGVEGKRSIKVAVTEVQLRYFVDERVVVLSLDGRTSSDIITYFNRSTGVPDFDKYLKKTKPDFVQLGQWGARDDWFTRRIIKIPTAENLVGNWEKQMLYLKKGDSFLWEGHEILVLDENYVRICW